MSIKPFENLACSQLEALIKDGYIINLFRMGTLIFLNVHDHHNGLLLRAVGESIATAFKRAESYVGHNTFSMPELYTDHLSKLDSLILDYNASIILESFGNSFRGKISSHDEYVLIFGKGDNITSVLQSLEVTAIQYGL